MRLSTRLELHVGVLELGLEPSDQLWLVREAEAFGFDSIWPSRASGSDAATVLSGFRPTPSGSRGGDVRLKAESTVPLTVVL